MNSHPGKSLVLQVLMLFILYQQIATKSDNNPDTLGNMNIDKDRITLSGFSSGGAFAQMLQFSYSSLFSGIATFSHSFYRCGPPSGRQIDYDRVCTTLGNLTEDMLYDPNLVHVDIQDYSKRGLIEDPSNLRNKRLYVYAGLRNEFFSIRQSLNVLSVYERYINSTESIFTRVQDANLVLPTDKTNVGGPCTQTPTNETFFIGQCGFSGITEAINFLLNDDLTTLHDAHVQYKGHHRSRIRTFDQREFIRGLRFHQMDDVGYYYVPRRCRRGSHQDNRCLLHFYFHGCLVGREFVGENHIANTGLLELADRKGMIVIFPQAISTSDNDIGCWDTYGIGGRFYATQIGHQIVAVKRMLDRTLGYSAPPSRSSASVEPSKQSFKVSSSYSTSRASSPTKWGRGKGRVERQNNFNQPLENILDYI